MSSTTMVNTVNFEYLLLGAAILLLLGVLAGKASDRLGVPALLLFLGVGMLAGSEGIGGIHFDNYLLSQDLGIAALGLILFSGGLGTRWTEVRPVLRPALSLATFGVLGTALAMAAFAHFALALTWCEALILGAIVSSTDAAAVFSILRSKGANFKGNLKPLLELESGSNDPMAVFLTIAFVSLAVQGDQPLLALLPLFVTQMLVGLALGILGGRLMLWVINRIDLNNEGLYPVLTLGLALFTFSATARLGGSGFLAVYVAGIILGNRDFIHKNSLLRFHDGVAWLMQITMFLVLGLLVFPSHLVPVIGIGTLAAFFLMLVARPLSVFAALAFSGFSFREKLLVSWVGLRGAVPIVLATYPLMAGLGASETIFNLVFFVVLLSVVLQGTSLSAVTRLLKLDNPTRQRRTAGLEFNPAQATPMHLVEIEVPDDSPIDGRPIVALGLPGESLIVLISRGKEYVMPRGSTEIKSGDVVMLLAGNTEQEAVQELFTRGAISRPPRPPA